RVMPCVTESIWECVNQVAPERGVPNPVQSPPFVMKSEWPTAVPEHHDESIERQFAEFQEVVGAIRKIRASQNIAPRETVPVAIRCSDSSLALLEPMASYFAGLAGADVVAIGPTAAAFETDAPLALTSIDVDVHVDLEKFIDIEAELARLDKLKSQLEKQIKGKQQKLGNENFVARAPTEVVDKERATLADLEKQSESVEGDIERLRKKSSP
ncbi:MAG TPA: valine--tRNA ligase, partial [Rhodopirellula sp.]|nr:valine--tRNA ligase [Rhodopirellula sp.]